MFVTPRYGDGALTDLVPSVLGVLGVAGESDRIGLGVDGLHRVAILLIDGMGADLVAARRDVAPLAPPWLAPSRPGTSAPPGSR